VTSEIKESADLETGIVSHAGPEADKQKYQILQFSENTATTVSIAADEWLLLSFFYYL